MIWELLIRWFTIEAGRESPDFARAGIALALLLLILLVAVGLSLGRWNHPRKP